LDISFDPFPAIPPNANHGCHYTTIGADITVSCTPPCPNLDPTSADVITTTTANADSHLQTYERGKLGRNNKTDKSTLITTIGDTTIGNIIDRNMLLFPFAIDPLGRFGPILQHFLFDIPPTTPLQFSPSKPNATKMYNRFMHFPSPKGILKLAKQNWSNLKSQQFYGHSYSAPTPTIATIQQLGLTILKAFAHHIRYASRKFSDHPAHILPPSGIPNPPFNGH
jgi:hypothetical protein